MTLRHHLTLDFEPSSLSTSCMLLYCVLDKGIHNGRSLCNALEKYFRPWKAHSVKQEKLFPALITSMTDNNTKLIQELND